MWGQKQFLASELTEDLPVVFLLIEERNSFIDHLITFLENSGLEVRLFLLDSFVDPEQALIQYQVIKQAALYKLLVVGGFCLNFIKNSSFLIRTLKALEVGFAEDEEDLPVFFLLNYSSPLSPVGFQLKNYELFWTQQKMFLSQALRNFPQAEFCLMEDYVDLEFDFNLKYNLFFSLFKERLLLDSYSECFWQTKDSFFINFKRALFKGEVGNKLLLRGKKTQGGEFLSSAQDLCSRYFLEDFSLVALFFDFVEEKTLLADFVRIYYSSPLAAQVLDQKIRQLPFSLNDQLLLKQNDLTALKEEKILQNIQTPTEAVKKHKVTKTKDVEPVKDEEKAVHATIQAQNEQGQALKNSLNEKIAISEIKNKIDKSSDIDKKLQDIFRSEQRERQELRFSKNLKGARKIVKKSKYRRLSFYLGVFFASAGLLLLLVFANFYITQRLFQKNLLSNIEEYSFTIKSAVPIRGKNYVFFKKQLDFYQKLFGADFLSTVNSHWLIYANIQVGQELAEKLQDKSYALYKEIIQTDGYPEPEWQAFLRQKEEYYQHNQELLVLLKQLNLEILPENQAKVVENFTTSVSKEIRIQQRSLAFLETISELMLSPARSNIAILIQDSNELRSSGGFLTSMAIFSFEKSRLLNWQVYDVADLDQRIYGDKQASEELKNLLVVDRLLLRDANWLANFREAGTDIAWFIEQSLNLRPDLILSLSSKELYELFTPFFPITINGFALAENNYFDELLRLENFDFDQFSNEIFKRIVSAEKFELNYLFRELLIALESREGLMYSDNNQLMAVLKNNLWSGELLETPCPSDFAKSDTACFTDGIYQLDNNVGLNKVNRLITQKIDHSVGISENFIRHKRVLSLENLSRQSFWPEGAYQVYLKFYIPQSARLENIRLDEKAINQGTYSWFEESGRRVIALKLTVPVLSKVNLELVYLIPHELKAPFSYVFLDQKQAGHFNKETAYRVVFSEEFQPNLIAPQANYLDKVIEFKNQNLDNYLFAISF